LVVIDLSLVDYVSSAGIGALERAADVATKQGITLVIAGVAEPVRMALDLAGILPKLAIEPTRSVAVARLRPATGT